MDLENTIAACTGSPLISVRGLRKTYQTEGAVVNAVDGVDLDVVAGEFLMITGRSGSGKTTLLNLIAGLATPTAGTVQLECLDLWSLSDRDRTRLRGERVGFVFQFPSLVPSLSAAENVELQLGLWGGEPDAAARHTRALEVLDAVGLGDKHDSRPRQLSAGEQQRVVLARALARRPSVILADEPTSNLDEATEADVMRIFHDLHATTGVTLVMVTHSSELLSWGTRALRMASGRVSADEATGRSLR